MVFRWFYKVFGPPRGSKLDLMLDLVLGVILEASWSYLGRVLGGQDAPKTDQDGAKTRQDGAKTAQDGAKTGHVGARTDHDGPIRRETAQDFPRWSRFRTIELSD